MTYRKKKGLNDGKIHVSTLHHSMEAEKKNKCKKQKRNKSKTNKQK